MDVSSFLSDRIFYSTMWSFRPSCEVQKVRKDVQKLKRQYPEGTTKSNFGGWQSPTIKMEDSQEYPTLYRLQEELGEFIKIMSEKDGTPVIAENFQFWANESKKHDYNQIHDHPRTDYFGVYYSKYPEDSGPLEIIRSDAGRLLTQNWVHSRHFAMGIKGEEGRMYVFSGHLLHLVHPHTSDKTRQSLAYNVQVGPPPGLQ